MSSNFDDEKVFISFFMFQMRTRREGVKKSENFADVLNGSSPSGVLGICSPVAGPAWMPTGAPNYSLPPGGEPGGGDRLHI